MSRPVLIKMNNARAIGVEHHCVLAQIFQRMSAHATGAGNINMDGNSFRDNYTRCWILCMWKIVGCVSVVCSIIIGN